MNPEDWVFPDETLAALLAAHGWYLRKDESVLASVFQSDDFERSYIEIHDTVPPHHAPKHYEATLLLVAEECARLVS